MATRAPGFTDDEADEELGSSLTLPERLEDERDRIESRVPEFDGPSLE